MRDVPGYTPEEESEPILSGREIKDTFQRILKGQDFETDRIIEDEKGIYTWSITVPDPDGGQIEYTYVRKGNHEAVQAKETVIHVVYYDENGIPVGGRTVANYVDGKWDK